MFSHWLLDPVVAFKASHCANSYQHVLVGIGTVTSLKSYQWIQQKLSIGNWWLALRAATGSNTGLICKFKTQFCCQGDQQKDGVDYFGTFVPVVSWNM
eukprot:7864137-Ditylum_brightwellii.AAC.1